MPRQIQGAAVYSGKDSVRAFAEDEGTLTNTCATPSRREALAQASTHYKQHKTLNKPFTPSEFGFDCSSAEIERQITRGSALAAATKP